jgi:Leucine-rich repeat (LRR) protein
LPPYPFLRILSFNNLTRLDAESLAELSSLTTLRLSHNAISHIAEGAFKGLKNLRILYGSHCLGVGVGEQNKAKQLLH